MAWLAWLLVAAPTQVPDTGCRLALTLESRWSLEVRFEGNVQSRSSADPNHGPPGESEIQRLNPSRRETILDITGWPDLEPGTLNLQVPNSVLDALDNIEPVWVEDCSRILYPKPYEHIPAKRVAYYYYLGETAIGELAQDILVRKAKVPVLERVELLAPIKLRKHLDLCDGDSLGIEVFESKST